MLFKMYRLFNVNEFYDKNVYSSKLVLNFEDLGEKTILITNGIMLGITYEGIFLPINLNQKNPFYIDGHLVKLDENYDVYLGIEQDEN